MQTTTTIKRMYDRPVEGFSMRLRDALSTSQSRLGKRLTVAELGGLLKRRQDEIGRVPSSYRSLMLYLNGQREPSNAAFSRQAAAILRVRWDWLHNNSGQMTEAVDVYLSTLTATATPAIIGAHLVRSDPEATLALITQIAPPLKAIPAGLATFVEVWDRVVRSSSSQLDHKQRLAVAEALWDQLTGSLRMLGVDPTTAPGHYFITALSALMTVIPGSREGPDMTAGLRGQPKKPAPTKEGE